MPHIKYEVNRPRNFRGDSFRKCGWKMKEKMQKMLNPHNFHHFSIDRTQDASHEIWSQSGHKLHRRQYLKIVLKQIKKHFGTKEKVLNYNVHNFRSDPPHDASNEIWSLSAQELQCGKAVHVAAMCSWACRGEDNVICHWMFMYGSTGAATAAKLQC